MDSVRHSLGKTCVIDEYCKDVVPSKRDVFLSTYHCHQKWSLPSSIVYYLAKNPPNSNFYQKLIKCCKYFFIVNPIIVTPFLLGNFDEKWYFSFDGNQVDLENCQSTLWLTNELFITKRRNVKAECIGSFIVPKLYAHNLKELTFLRQKILVNDFQLLGEKCKLICLCDSFVLDKFGGINIGLERIVENLPSITTFCASYPHGISNVINSKTVEEMLKLSQYDKMNYFELKGISDAFDIYTFFDHVKKVKKLKVYLAFNSYISEEYRESLGVIANEIVGAESHDYRFPYISFFGIDQLLLKKIRKRFFSD